MTNLLRGLPEARESRLLSKTGAFGSFTVDKTLAFASGPSARRRCLRHRAEQVGFGPASARPSQAHETSWTASRAEQHQG